MTVVVLIALGLIGVAFVGALALVVFSSTDNASAVASPPPRPVPSPGDGETAGSASLVPLSGRGWVSVVGESHYQPALRHVSGGAVADGHPDAALPAVAVLVPEPRNRHDRNAVRVDIDGRKVGYLSRQAAAEFQPALLTLERHGQRGWCRAGITGGGQRKYGVFLRLGQPERMLLVNGQPADTQLLEPSTTVAVTREGVHTDTLRALLDQYGSNDEMAAVATLEVATVTAGKHAGQPCLHVNIDGHRVGELTHRMSQRYLPMVRDLGGGGRLPACEATVRTTNGNPQVEVHLPASAPGRDV